MASSQSVKKRKGRKKAGEAKPDVIVPQIVTKTFAENVYTGLMQKGAYGTEYLDSATATYHWKATGVTYEGPFVQSHIKGKGKFSWPDGSSYEGELHNGKRHGEGIYLCSGGIPKYEGQWNLGKRHGHGKLIYNAEGSFYDGEWCDGEKHGDGYQIWPSGNVYHGQWKEGKMRGQGSMYWRGANGLEEYTGNWVDGKPHGVGTHIWHASVSLTSGKPIQQQLNNRYTGEFHYGNREGKGTFYYANGSYYCGEWKNHQKHGRGRHTFEDGRVQEGIFVNDRMMGSPEHEEPQVLPPGYAEENPVCRCTELSDLEPFAYPPDCSGLHITSGTNYSDVGKIYREVFNTLLRHLGELKDIYSRYRMIFSIPGEDPFALANVKLWAFARDFGIITPSCSLARFDRAVFSGPRNHREIAPDDMADLRPVTPRAAESRRFSIDGPVPEPLSEHAFEGMPPGSQLGGTSVTDFSEASSVGSSPSQLDREITEPSPGLIGVIDNPLEAGAPPRSLPLTSDEEFTTFTHWQRQPGTQGLAATHSLNRPLLYRQFLDGVVRISIARFPHERGLESQIFRLFELIEANQGKAPASDATFVAVVMPEFRKILDSFEPLITQLFVGPQAFIEPPSADEQEVISARIGVDVTKVDCIRKAGAFGMPLRRFHVQSRADMTVRVKDVLRFLDHAGLLLPITWDSFPAEDPYAPIFSTASEPDRQDKEKSAEDTIATAEATATAGDSNDAADGRRLSSSVPPEVGGPDGQAAATTSGVIVSAADFENCDMRFTIEEVLQLIAGTLAPGSTELIRLQLDRNQMTPNTDLVSLLEYMESELVPAEFERLLIAIADIGTSRKQEFAAQVPLPSRVEGFLRCILAPSLLRPYNPPPPPLKAEPVEVPKPATEGAEGEDAEAAAPGAADAEESEDVSAEVGEVEKRPPLEMWAGFDDGGDTQALAAPRRWLEGYEAFVIDW